jgi:hypothetical protein
MNEASPMIADAPAESSTHRRIMLAMADAGLLLSTAKAARRELEAELLAAATEADRDRLTTAIAELSTLIEGTSEAMAGANKYLFVGVQ